MEPRILLEMLHTAERLKDTVRHCYTSGGRRESVAEHSWRLALMAWWLRDEFPDVDMNKVVEMCLIHDLGEAFTGDIPVFNKTDSDRKTEDELLDAWVATLPEKTRGRMTALYREMNARQTQEAKLYKALDGMEALIQHNESDLATWEPHEYQLQMTYCNDRVTFSPYLTALREAVRDDTVRKVAESEAKNDGTLGSV